MTTMPAPNDGLGYLTSEEVARLDAAAAECGVSTLQLMEVAGWQVARCAWQHLGGASPVSVIAGYGNNGGDGLVAARHLATWGCGVQVLVLATELRVTGIITGHVLSARNCGVEVIIDADPGAVRGVVARSELILDFILGTGLRSAPREPQAGAIRAINGSDVPVLSVDVPSGLDASTGEAFDPGVFAALYVHPHRNEAGPCAGATAHTQAGEIWVADIGMPAVAWSRAGLRQPPRVTGGELVHTSS